MPAPIFELACDADDPDLRRLLRENPLQGSLSLSFEREPNYFNAAVIDGPFHQTVVGREGGGAIIGVGNRSVRPMFVNGQPRDVGYMSQLRVDAKYGKGLYLARGLGAGFKLYRALHADGRAPFYLMSIIEDNLPARRLLTSGLPSYPRAQEYTRLFTYAIYPVRRKPALPVPRALRLARGREQDRQSIVDCLNRNGARKQFASSWTGESLFAISLSPADFAVVWDGDHILGCLACWDQTNFKQTVVRGYSSALGRWRKLLNAGSVLGGWPYLPEPNTALRYSFASHLAIDGDDPAIFGALLRETFNYNLERGFHYFTLGLAESDPLRAVVERYRPLTYVSQIYLVAWEDGYEAVRQVDARPPALEIALL
jgi:hypothetical protein